VPYRPVFAQDHVRVLDIGVDVPEQSVVVGIFIQSNSFDFF